LSARQADFFPDRSELRSAVSTVAALSQQYIWFYPRLIHLAGGHKSALVLANLLHWTRHLKYSAPERNGWLWKTHSEWAGETGLSRHEFDAAKAQLQAKLLMQQVRKGMPARTFYRLDVDALCDALNELLHLPPGKLEWSWENSAAMLQLLGRPTVFYLKLAQILDSATDALQLSYFIQAQKAHLSSSLTSDWITPRVDHIHERLGLSYKQQLASRKRLATAGLIDARLSGAMTPRPEIRIRFARIGEAISGNQASFVPEKCSKNAHVISPSDRVSLASGGSSTTLRTHHAAVNNKQNSTDGISHTESFVQFVDQPATNRPGGKLLTFPANSNLQIRHTGNADIDTQDIPNSATKNAEKGTLYIDIKHTQPPLQGNADSGKQQDTTLGCGGSGDEVFSIEVDEGHPAIRPFSEQLRSRLTNASLSPTQAQALADEWVGRITDVGQQPLRYPLRYLDSLIKRAAAGEFTPELGVGIAQIRIAAKRKQALFSTFTKPANSDTRQGHPMTCPGKQQTGPSSVMTAERLKLQMLRQSFVSKVLQQSGGSSTTPMPNGAAIQSGGSSTTPMPNGAAIQSGGSSTTPMPNGAAIQSGGSSTTQPKSAASILLARLKAL
jgi:hypothetical protein